MIVRCKNKAKKIRNNKQKTKKEKEKYKVIVVPHSSHVDTIAQFLKAADVKVMSKAGKSVGQILKGKCSQEHENSSVYMIPCTGCNKPYYGETGRSLKVRLKEHQKDIQYQRDKTIVKHSNECDALPNWKNAKNIAENIDKNTRIAIEAAVLEVQDCMNPKTGRISLAETAAKLILAVHPLNM